MKHFNNITIQLIFASFIFVLTGCNPNHKQSNKIEQIKTVADSLQKIYAPDKRVSLWMLAISDKYEKPNLELLVDKKETYEVVKKTFDTRFPGLTIKIELLPKNNLGQTVSALANNSVINLRSNPRHSAELATQVTLGTPLKVLEKKGEWYLVQTPNKYIAWVDEPAIVEINPKELQAYKTAKKIVFNNQYGFSYSKPDDKSQVVTDLVVGSILPVIEETRKFYKVQYPDHRKGWVKKKECISFDSWIKRDIDEKTLIETALKFNGLPYLWGGTSAKAMDCSGFTSSVYLLNGIVLQRDASQQTKYGKVITTKYEYSNLKPGDLLFFGRPASDSLPERVTHVALYIGNSLFIHASGKVRINSIDSTNKQFISSYVPRFVRAVRIKGHLDNFGAQRITENNFYKEIMK